MQIHLARNGRPMGPFTLEEVNRQVAEGTVRLSHLAWYEGASGWAPLSTVPGVIGSDPASPTPMAGGSATAAPVSSGSPEPLAILSLVLSVLGMFGFCCMPVVMTAIAGIVCGHLALSKIGRTPGLQGHGLAVAGLIIGYSGIAFWLLCALVWGGFGLLQGILEHVSK
jgi:hypothetical protein